MELPEMCSIRTFKFLSQSLSFLICRANDSTQHTGTWEIKWDNTTSVTLFQIFHLSDVTHTRGKQLIEQEELVTERTRCFSPSWAARRRCPKRAIHNTTPRKHRVYVVPGSVLLPILSHPGLHPSIGGVTDAQAGSSLPRESSEIGRGGPSTSQVNQVYSQDKLSHTTTTQTTI